MTRHGGLSVTCWPAVRARTPQQKGCPPSSFSLDMAFHGGKVTPPPLLFDPPQLAPGVFRTTLVPTSFGLRRRQVFCGLVSLRGASHGCFVGRPCLCSNRNGIWRRFHREGRRRGTGLLSSSRPRLKGELTKPCATWNEPGCPHLTPHLSLGSQEPQGGCLGCRRHGPEHVYGCCTAPLPNTETLKLTLGASLEPYPGLDQGRGNLAQAETPGCVGSKCEMS